MIEDNVLQKRPLSLTEEVPLKFQRTWDTHRPRIWRLVARLSGSTDWADDLTQEVGIKAFQAYKDFRKEAQAYSWLYRIAVNVVLRHREGRHETLSLDALGMETFVFDRVQKDEKAFSDEDLRPLVREALERLPDDQRTTLILFTYEELTYREIARVLEIPVGTVMSRLHTARQRLRQELKNYAL